MMPQYLLSVRYFDVAGDFATNLSALVRFGMGVYQALHDAGAVTFRRWWPRWTVRNSAMNSCHSAGPPAASSSARTPRRVVVGRWCRPHSPSWANTGTSWIDASVKLERQSRQRANGRRRRQSRSGLWQSILVAEMMPMASSASAVMFQCRVMLLMAIAPYPVSGWMRITFQYPIPPPKCSRCTLRSL